MAFPQTLLGVKVELFYDGVWNALPPGTVRGLGAEDGEISIGLRGQPDESSGIVTTEAELSINNRNGMFSPRNLVSPLYGKIGANTPLRISADVDSLIALSDPFDTPGVNGWPNAPTGHVYTCTGGSAADFSVSGGLARQSHAAVNVEHTATVSNVISTDHEILVTGITMSAVILTDNVEVIVRSRENGSQWCQTRVLFKPDNTITLVFDYSFGTPTLNFVTIPLASIPAFGAVSLRVNMSDDVYRVRAWVTGAAEPTDWNITVAGLTMPTGVISIRSKLTPAMSSALPFIVRFQALDISYGIVVFHGEVAEWPHKWDSTGSDVWVALTASGITRRLQQNAKPLRSPLYRHMVERDLLGYWSFEQMSGDQGAYLNGLASDLPNGFPFTTQSFPVPAASGGYGGSPTVNWAGDNTLLGSDSLPVATKGTEQITSLQFNNAQLIPTDITDDAFSIGVWLNGTITEANATSAFIFSMRMANSDVSDWIVQVNHLASPVPVFTTEVSSFSTLVGGAPFGGPGLGVTSIPYSPGWRYYLFNGVQSGGNIVMRIFVDGVNVASGSVAMSRVGQPVSVETAAIGAYNTPATKTSWGHLAISSGATGDDLTNNLATTYSIGKNAYAGETATSRIGRLFTEEGYTIDLDFDSTFSTLMGPQGTKTFLASIEEAAKADDGVLFEQRGKLGYKYISRGRLYNRSSQITLDYSNTDLGDVPEVTDDDQRIMNKFLVTRQQSGATVLAERTTGPMSTSAPDASVPGVGTYDDGQTVNLYEDGQLPDYANWRVHLGTWDESRWPAIRIALHRTPFAGNLAQLTRAAFLDIADVFTVINTPEWLPPGSVLLQMRAVKMFLSNFNWGVEWTALPAGPWQVSTAAGVYAEGAARADTASSTLVTAISDSATELALLTNETNLPWSDPLWTEDMDQVEYPHENGFDLRLNPQTRKGGNGGERVRVAANYIAVDTFTHFVQVSGSNADTGQTWASSTMTAPQPQGNGSSAVFTHTAANTEAFLVLPTGSVDGVASTIAFCSTLSPTGASLVAHIVIRYIDANNYYAARLTMAVGSSNVDLDVIKVVAGVTTVLSQPTNSPISVPAFTATWVKIRAYGRDLSAKAWQSGTNEPEWQIELPDTATENMTGTSIGLRTIRTVGNTNANSGYSFSRINLNAGRIRPYAYDYFNRTTVNGLGSAVVGSGTQAWTVYAVTAPISAADHQVTPNQATVTIPAVGAIRGGFLSPQVLQNAQVSAIVTMPLATGGSLSSVLFVRGSALLFRLVASTTNTLAITAFDTGGSLGSMALPWLTHAAINQYRFKIFAEGANAGAKVWMVGQNEPDNWMFRATTVALGTSFCGWFGQRDAGNTNVNPQLTFADFKINNPQRITVQRGVEGVSRAWDAGIDGRLWTPTRLAR